MNPYRPPGRFPTKFVSHSVPRYGRPFDVGVRPDSGSWRPRVPRGPVPVRPTYQGVYQQPRTTLTQSHGSFYPRGVNPSAPRPVPPWVHQHPSRPYSQETDPYTKGDDFSQAKIADISGSYGTQSSSFSDSHIDKSSDFMLPGSADSTFSEDKIVRKFDYNHGNYTADSQQAVGESHIGVNRYNTQPSMETSQHAESVHSPAPVLEKETTENFLKTWNKLTQRSLSQIKPHEQSDELPQSKVSKEIDEESKMKDIVNSQVSKVAEALPTSSKTTQSSSVATSTVSASTANKPKVKSITFNWKNPSVIGEKKAGSLPSTQSVSTSVTKSTVSVATPLSATTPLSAVTLSSASTGQTTQQMNMSPSYSHSSWPRGPLPTTNQVVYHQPRTTPTPSSDSFYPRGVNPSAPRPSFPWRQQHPSSQEQPQHTKGDFYSQGNTANMYKDFSGQSRSNPGDLYDQYDKSSGIQSLGSTDNAFSGDYSDGKYELYDPGNSGQVGSHVRGFESRGRGQVRHSLLDAPVNVDYRVHSGNAWGKQPLIKTSQHAESVSTPPPVPKKEKSESASKIWNNTTQQSSSQKTPVLQSDQLPQSKVSKEIGEGATVKGTHPRDYLQRVDQNSALSHKTEVKKDKKSKNVDESCFICTLCNISIQSEAAYEKHIKGLLHTNKLQTAQQEESNKTSQSEKSGSSSQMPAKQPDKSQTTASTDNSEEDSDEEDTSKCIYCNMTFTNADSYVKHTRGMLHTQNLMAAEAAKKEGTFETIETKSAIEETKDIQVRTYEVSRPTPGRMSQTFADEATEEEDDYDFNCSNWMDMDYNQTKKVPVKDRDLDLCDVGPHNDWHCEICNISCTGEDNFQMHLNGNKHKAKLKMRQNAKALLSLVGPEVPNEESPVKSQEAKISEQLQKAGIPLLGLQYVTEFQDLLNSKQNRYVCNLCEAKCDANTLTSHLIGTKHRLRYFKEDYPDIYKHLTTVAKKSDLNKSLDEFGAEIFAEEGYQQIKTKLASQTEVETQVIRLLSKQGIIRPEISQVFKELGKMSDQEKESGQSKTEIEDRLLKIADMERKPPLKRLMEPTELFEVKRMREYDRTEEVSSLNDSSDPYRDSPVENRPDGYGLSKVPRKPDEDKISIKQVFDYGHTKSQVIDYHHSPSTDPQTVEHRHSDTKVPQTQYHHSPSTEPQTVEHGHSDTKVPQTQYHHSPSTEPQTERSSMNKEQTTTIDSSKEKLFEEFLEWKNFREMKMMSKNMSGESTSSSKSPSLSTEKGAEKHLKQSENQNVVTNNSQNSQFSQGHGGNNPGQTTGQGQQGIQNKGGSASTSQEQKTYNPVTESEGQQQIKGQGQTSQENIKSSAKEHATPSLPAVNIQEMIGNLSSSLIKSEDEAAMVLEVSNALTQALLQYRLKHVPNEVKTGLAKVMDKTKNLQSRKMPQETSKKSESATNKSSKDSAQIPSSSMSAVQKRVASGYSLPPISLPEAKIPKMTESSNKVSSVSTMKGQIGQPAALGTPSTAIIPKLPMGLPTGAGIKPLATTPSLAGQTGVPVQRLSTGVGIKPLATTPSLAGQTGVPVQELPTGAGKKPLAATTSLAGQTGVPVQGLPTGAGIKPLTTTPSLAGQTGVPVQRLPTGARIKPLATTPSLAGQTRLPVQGQVVYNPGKQQGYMHRASTKPATIPKFPDQLAAAGASSFPLQSGWQNMPSYPGQTTMVYTQQIAMSQNCQTQYFMPSVTTASNFPSQGFVPQNFPLPDQPPLPNGPPPPSEPPPPPPPEFH